jgi:UDP-N-acetylglucosamine diphosphorylase / glucose-1-phosphate thymidylyltransferase / UDP-N-acetylgalactosamine diphosphorylase / glucosamine-1-phosphate N-acetyltransferase / galactosamine-1-phosphate N-acetyltransferase
VTAMATAHPTMFVLYDDRVARGFEPFATSRPLGEMRAGALLIRERWAHVLGGNAVGFAARSALRDFAEFDSPDSVAGDIPAGTVIVNTRALPFLAAHHLGPGDVWTVDGRVAAIRLRAPMNEHELRDGDWSLDDFVADDSPRVSLDGVWLDEVWDLLRHLSPLLLADIPALAASLRCHAVIDDPSSLNRPVLLGAHPLWVEDGATVEPYAVFDTTLGPVLLRRGSTVQAFTRVVGPCYVGVDSTVTADKVSGSSIGDVCRVHGELSASIFIGHANKGHDGFVGHSVVGRWVNMGAGTITSNLKNTYGTVALWTPDGTRDTGMQFLGTLFGDHTKTGIGMRLTTGCVLGAGANVMDRMPPKFVSPFSWGTGEPYGVFDIDKFADTAARMMARRGVTFDERQRAFWQALHAEQMKAAQAVSDAASHGSR